MEFKLAALSGAVSFDHQTISRALSVHVLEIEHSLLPDHAFRTVFLDESVHLTPVTAHSAAPSLASLWAVLSPCRRISAACVGQHYTFILLRAPATSGRAIGVG